MACSSERTQSIAALAAGELGADETDELLAHVETCEPCSAELDLAADLTRLTTASVSRPRLQIRRWAAAAALLLVFLGAALFPRPGSWYAQLEPIVAPPTTLRGAGGSQGESGAVRELRQRAMQAYTEGDFALATALLEELVGELGEEAPSTPLTRLYLGISLLQIEEWERAKIALRSASELGSGLVAERATWYLAQAHLALDEKAAARELLWRLAGGTVGAGDYSGNAFDQLDEIGRGSDD